VIFMPDAPTPVFVTSEAAKAVFSWREAIQALQAAYAEGITSDMAPRRTVLSGQTAWMRTLSAMPPGGRYFGAKLMGMSVKAASPGVEYVIVLFDRETSRIAAFVDANLITGFRTAATSAAAIARIAPEGPARLAVLGSGLEATMHTRALASIRPLTGVTVFSPTAERRAAFAESVTRELGLPARATDTAQEAVEGAQLVLAAARSRGERPILFGEWLAPSCTVCSIGSTVPEQREIDVSVVERSDLIVCDALDEVLEETGDMIAARGAGIVVSHKVFGLTDVMRGAVDEQIKTAGIRMYKSVGGGLQDIVVAELILTKAIDAGLVTPLPITFETKR